MEVMTPLTLWVLTGLNFCFCWLMGVWADYLSKRDLDGAMIVPLMGMGISLIIFCGLIAIAIQTVLRGIIMS